MVLALAGVFYAIPLVLTTRAREVHHIYVSGWNFLAALLWFPAQFVFANIPGFHSGVEEATVNWWFAHNVLGLWLTPLGVGTSYYFIPKIIGQPIYSYSLSLLGFWSLALFYSQVGIHHLIGGPVPTWVATLSIVHSVMMFIPVIAVAVAGAAVTMDGVILSGETLLDRAVLTGESAPVSSLPGDRVEAGSINLVGRIVVRVDRLADDREIDRMGGANALEIARRQFRRWRC